MNQRSKDCLLWVGWKCPVFYMKEKTQRQGKIRMLKYTDYFKPYYQTLEDWLSGWEHFLFRQRTSLSSQQLRSTSHPSITIVPRNLMSTSTRHTHSVHVYIYAGKTRKHTQQVKLSKYNLRLLSFSVVVYKIHLSPIHHNKIREVNISMFEMYIFICRPDLAMKTTANQLENLHAME